MSMNEKEIQALAVAYAQTKLMISNLEEKDKNGFYTSGCDSKEIKDFLKAYRFALNNIPNEWENLD